MVSGEIDIEGIDTDDLVCKEEDGRPPKLICAWDCKLTVAIIIENMKSNLFTINLFVAKIN